jgi:hypothetical protein
MTGGIDLYERFFDKKTRFPVWSRVAALVLIIFFAQAFAYKQLSENPPSMVSVPNDHCSMHSYVAPRASDLPSDVVRASQTIVICNKTYDVPYTLIVEFDSNISRAGLIEFPMGGMSEIHESFDDHTISAVIDAPIIRAYEPFIIFAYSANNKPPIAKTLTVKTASMTQHFDASTLYEPGTPQK